MYIKPIEEHQGKRDFFERTHKIPKPHRYTNISTFWIPYFPYVIRMLYVLKIPHEWVSLISTFFGFLSAYFIFTAQSYTDFFIAAISFHLKDIFDACDGALARLTNRGHRIGRFFDSLSDFLTITLTFGAVLYLCLWLNPFETAFLKDSLPWVDAIGVWNLIFLGLGILSILSIFLQCSYFNFYQLSYIAHLQEKRLSSRIDESITETDRKIYRHVLLRGILIFLQTMYQYIYGWQDRWMVALDTYLKRKRTHGSLDQWYTQRSFLTANSVLCFGTHIFILVACLLLGNPVWSLLIITLGLNLYWLVLMIVRIYR